MDTLQVLARANPQDKLLVTAGLKNQGKQVAVIGDGLNDVPAFKAADVSFSMMSGTAFARSNSSMVLTTNDFESCLRAVMWGRNIYTNIKRFL
jgi:P-type E1-E2 ATPase